MMEAVLYAPLLRRLCLIVGLAYILGATPACRRRVHAAPEAKPGATPGASPGKRVPSPSASVTVAAGPPAPRLSASPTSATVPNTVVLADAGAPSGYEHVAVWDLVPTADGAAVLLIDASHTTVLPIFVGGTEALTIRLDLDGKHYDRPLTHDLLASIIRELGGQPIKAQIDDLRDDTYFGSVFVSQGERILQLDARPSDAIAIALGSGAPLYVSRSVMLASGVPREAIEHDQKSRDLGS
jgi:bifunctional DNase/RNase